MSNNYTAIDCFCGAGGFSLGFEYEGFKILSGYDIEPKFKDTYNKNHKNKVYKICNISDGVPESVKGKNIDVILGSPPCQGFSDARGNRNVNCNKEISRIKLSFDFLSIIETLRPKIVLMENVPGMKTFKLNGKSFLSLLLKI